MKKILKEIIINEKGASIVLVALMMVVLLGFSALAVDGGNLWFTKRHLTTVADAAALAGVQDLVKIHSEGLETSTAVNMAKVSARDYAQKNGVTVNTADIVVSEDNKVITVPVVQEVETYFARVLGFKKIPVNSEAKATYESVTKFITDGSSGNLLPLCTTEDTVKSLEDGEDFVIKKKDILDVKGNTVSGNWGFASFYSAEKNKALTGAAVLNYLLSGGDESDPDSSLTGSIEIEVGDSVIDTEPGNIASSAKALDERFTKEKYYGVVPVVDLEGGKKIKGGRLKELPVVDLIVIKIINYDQHQITVQFTNESPADFLGESSSNSEDETSIKIMKLIE